MEKEVQPERAGAPSAGTSQGDGRKMQALGCPAGNEEGASRRGGHEHKGFGRASEMRAENQAVQGSLRSPVTTTKAVGE